MPLDADVAALVDALAATGAPALSEGTVEHARANYLAAPRPELDELDHVVDLIVDGRHGPVPIRAYATTSSPTDLPIMLFMHGGGWVLSSIDGHDHLARRLARETGALVVSVDYRLAPEHAFPVPHDDCWDVLTFLLEHAEYLGGDAAKFVVCGDSAGGNLAAGLALRARDEGIGLAAQVLIYPCIDNNPSPYPSMVDNATGYFLTASDMAWFWRHYLGDARSTSAYAVPALAHDVTGVAPAMVITAEYDPLRDEGEHYAQRLIDAGVHVDAIRVPGVVHGYVARWHLMARANDTLAGIARFVRSIVD
jgi:acetyl esterase